VAAGPIEPRQPGADARQLVVGDLGILPQRQPGVGARVVEGNAVEGAVRVAVQLGQQLGRSL
jgi:hypothetical protein